MPGSGAVEREVMPVKADLKTVTEVQEYVGGPKKTGLASGSSS